MKYEVAVIMGRFQPFHKGHGELIDRALEVAEKVLIVIGSAGQARSLRNPFSMGEREELIRLNCKDPSRMQFVGVRDYFYNDMAWINEVGDKTKAVGGSGRIVFIDHNKDMTSKYLNWFPDWKSEDVTGRTDCHATAIRGAYLRDKKSIIKDRALSAVTQDWLIQFATTEAYSWLHEEQLAIDEYKKSWASAPFPPIFVTTDALVVCAGHMLLIKRKHSPGKGLWAIPGGFLDAGERIEHCVLRELDEETKIEVSRAALVQSLEAVRVFDHPLRSSRGRTITHAHLFCLNMTSLPSVCANDDATAAKWIPLLDIGKMEEEFFEDHFHLINNMIGRVRPDG